MVDDGIGVADNAQVFGHHIGGVGEGVGADEGAWNPTVFERNGVVHTARAARTSVADPYQRKVTAVGDQVDHVLKLR